MSLVVLLVILCKVKLNVNFYGHTFGTTLTINWNFYNRIFLNPLLKIHLQISNLKTFFTFISNLFFIFFIIMLCHHSCHPPPLTPLLCTVTLTLIYFFIFKWTNFSLSLPLSLDQNVVYCLLSLAISSLCLFHFDTFSFLFCLKGIRNERNWD